MVEALWSEQGVGIVGGEPKCGKSFLALDLAVAVAAGVPCLRHFHAARSGAVLLVHHARKSGGSRPGQALRGSSELHAWGDSNLYLRRRDRQALMTVEHRDAPGLDDVEIELADDGARPAPQLREKTSQDDAPQPQPVASSTSSPRPKSRSPRLASENAPHCAMPPSPARSTSSCAKAASSGSLAGATGPLPRSLPATARDRPPAFPVPFPGPNPRR